MSREIWVDVRVTNPRNPKRAFTIRALVDDGSIDVALPATLLKRIGIRPEGVEIYEAWAGKRHRRSWGEARFEIQGKFGTTRVTFEPSSEIPTVGALALETLGFDIDMLNGSLRPVRRIGRGPRRRTQSRLVSATGRNPAGGPRSGARPKP